MKHAVSISENKEGKAWALGLAISVLASAAGAQSVDRLDAQGYRALDCVFRERCVIGQPCQRHYRDVRYWLNDALERGYREGADGRMRRGDLGRDARWQELSRARSITFPLREAVASRLTMFHDGGAILSVQYAADPGSGQFLRGSCGYADEGGPVRPTPDAAEAPAPVPLQIRPVGPSD